MVFWSSQPRCLTGEAVIASRAEMEDETCKGFLERPKWFEIRDHHVLQQHRHGVRLPRSLDPAYDCRERRILRSPGLWVATDWIWASELTVFTYNLGSALTSVRDFSLKEQKGLVIVPRCVLGRNLPYPY